jgi:lambda family phage portal protein
MKPNWWDNAIGFFSPDAKFNRLKAKARTEVALRTYDAAQKYSSDDWSVNTTQSANAEIRNAHSKIKDAARYLGRNNAYAIMGINSVVGNTVGTGIVPDFKSASVQQKKRAQKAWKEWGETPLCDANNMHNFYGLQAQVLRNVVESGEILGKIQSDDNGQRIKLLECDFLDTRVDRTGFPGQGGKPGAYEGIEVDADDNPTAYHIYKWHPYDNKGLPESVRIDAKDIMHVYRQERPGQLRGISWLAPVLRTLNNFDDYQMSRLIQQKGAASFMGFLTPPDSESAVPDTKEQFQNDFYLEAGTVKRLRPGEKVEFPNVPSVEGYADYCRVTLRTVAAGLGITYEALANDFSQVNYSSGRLGYLQMRKNIEMWRWQMLIPQFCDKGIDVFLKWAAIKYGVDPEQIEVKWVPPAWSMIDPNKEYEATKSAVRNGFLSWSQAVQELGNDPDQTLEEIQELNQKLDEMEIVLDSDPRQTNVSGSVQAAGKQDNSEPSVAGDNSNEATDNNADKGKPNSE